jgi:hypothetical protein
MRAVLDVNVLISAVISPLGAPGRILRFWEQDKFELATSPPILIELERVLQYPKIQSKYQLPAKFVKQFLVMIQGGAIVIEPIINITTIREDPSDNRYLECAVASEASYIVTGDKHLLNLNAFEGIQVLTPAAFLALLELVG